MPAGVTADISYSVAVRNADGTQVTMPQAFIAVAPVLQFVNSATKPSGNTNSTVILEGQAFGDAQGTGQVLFSNGSGGTIAATIADPGDWTNTFIVTTVPSSSRRTVPLAPRKAFSSRPLRAPCSTSSSVNSRTICGRASSSASHGRSASRSAPALARRSTKERRDAIRVG